MVAAVTDRTERLAPLDAVDGVDAALDLLDESLVAGILTPVQAHEMVARIERCRTRLAGCASKMILVIEYDGLHRDFGHKSAKAMYQHAGQTTGSEAHQLSMIAKFGNDVDVMAVTWASQTGEIGLAQIRRIMNQFNRKHLRAHVTEDLAKLLKWASDLSYFDFDRRVARWERLATPVEDQARAEAAHESRRARLRSHKDGSWHLDAWFGPTDGAYLKTVFDWFNNANFDRDSEVARSMDPNAGPDQFARTASQRAADSMVDIFGQACRRDLEGRGPNIEFVIKVDHLTFGSWLERLATGRPLADPKPGTAWREGFECETVDGYPIDVETACSQAVQTSFRTAVISSQGVTLDFGRQRDLSRLGKLAVKINHHRCVWPGCTTPISATQIDHLTPHSRLGASNPHNSACLCRFHNRRKRDNEVLHRDLDYYLATTRSGSVIPGPPTPIRI